MAPAADSRPSSALLFQLDERMNDSSSVLMLMSVIGLTASAIASVFSPVLSVLMFLCSSVAHSLLASASFMSFSCLILVLCVLFQWCLYLSGTDIPKSLIIDLFNIINDFGFLGIKEFVAALSINAITALAARSAISFRSG